MEQGRITCKMHIVVFEIALSRPIRYRYKSIMAIRSQDKTIATTRTAMTVVTVCPSAFGPSPPDSTTA
uniref:Uncharacterized protein n=1 Tax=Panagrellus redivivus TaxID=6233 RepID=A0A7E4ZQI2_PANRE